MLLLGWAGKRGLWDGEGKLVVVVVVVVEAISEELCGGVKTWERYRRCSLNLGSWKERVPDLKCSAG